MTDITATEETLTPISERPLVNRLTGEVALYIGLAVIALIIRLANLAATALNSPEAAQALVGLTLYQGLIPTEATNYSPLMASLNGFTFFLFGASDFTARLGSVGLGLALVLLPLGLRRQLGVYATLTASALFAFSAVGLYWSRINTGDMAVAVGSMLILVGLVQWFQTEVRLGVFLSVSGLVLLLTGTPSGFTALLVVAGFGGLISLLDREALHLMEERLKAGGFTLGQAGLFGAGLLILLGTAALFNLTGLAAISDLFTTWLGQLGLRSQPQAGYPAILMLVVYEPLVLIFGALGIARSFTTRHTLDQALVIWFGMVALLDLLMGGRDQGQVLLALVPLTLLASRSIGELLHDLVRYARGEAEGLLVSFGLILSTFVYISLTGWSKCPAGQPSCNTAWIVPLAGIALIGVICVIFGFWHGKGMAWRGLGALLLIIGSLFSIGVSWRLNYAPIEQLAFQPMIAQPPSTQLTALLDDITRLALERSGDAREIDLAVVNLNQPLLRWHLRDLRHVRFVGSAGEAPGDTVILTSPEAQPFGGGYVGQDFALTAHWSVEFGSFQDRLRWYLFRTQSNQLQLTNPVIMWVGSSPPLSVID